MKFDPYLSKAAEVNHVSGVSLNECLERPLYEAVKLKPGLFWKPKDAADAGAVGHLLRKAIKGE